MDPFDSLKLRKNWTLLLGSVNSEDVTPYLIQDLVLEPDVVDEINAQTTRKKKTEALLMRLLKAGPSAYDSFRRALAQQHVVYSEVISKLDNTTPHSSSGVDTPDSKFTFPQIRDLRLADSKDVPESLPGTLRSTEPVQPITAQPAEIPVSTRPFSDSECLTLAQFLGPEDLNSVGVKLEFFAAALRRYEQDNRRGAGGYEGMYNMLVDWKKNCLNSEQREKLSGALRQAGHANFAYQVRYGYKLESSPVQPTSVVSAPPLTPGRSDPNPSPSGWSQATSTSPSQPL